MKKDSLNTILKITLKQIKKGEDLLTFLDQLSNIMQQNFESYLQPFEPFTLITSWRQLMNSIDDFLNIYNELPTNTKKIFYSTELHSDGDPANTQYYQLLKELELNFGKSTKERFTNFYCQLFDYQQARYTAEAFGGSEFSNQYAFRDLNDVFQYLSGIRIYLQAIEVLIDRHCKGKKRLSKQKLLTKFLPRIDHILTPLATIYFQKLTSLCLEDYHIEIDSKMIKANKHFKNLENGSFEPQMVSVFDQLNYRMQASNLPSIAKSSSVFNFNELVGQIDLMGKVHDLYKITTFPQYTELKILLKLIKRYQEDNYSFTIKESEFYNIQAKLPNLDLSIRNSQLPDILYEFAPFRKHGQTFYTTIPLLFRYIDRLLTAKLNKVKRFQIHAGFTFEKRVNATLENFGFVKKQFKRLKKAEFDVIMELNGEIYNFQCKNNLIDTYSINQDPKVIAKKNAYLVKRYKSALLKERNRASLLQNQFPGKHINHYVISRFPVIHEVKNLINFNELENWAQQFAVSKLENEDIGAGLEYMIGLLESAMHARGIKPQKK